MIIAFIPLAFYLLKTLENDKKIELLNKGITNTRILSKTSYNSMLMTGANISALQVDMKEVLSTYSILFSEGLIYADIILISSNKKFNGIKLAQIAKHNKLKDYSNKKFDKINSDDLKAIIDAKAITETDKNGRKYSYTFINISPSSRTVQYPKCIGRMVFSHEEVMKPLTALKRVILLSIFISIILVSITGFTISRFISQPITELTSIVRDIETGNFDIKIPSLSNDEIGILANTFSRMLHIIHQKVEELTESNEKLKVLDELKNEFFISLSQEFRNPINGIIGLTESLMQNDNIGLTETTKHDLDTILISGQRLTHMVNEIMDFSRLKHNDLYLSKNTVNMYSVTEHVIALLKPEINKKNLIIKNEISQDNNIIWADENRIIQIMMNLLDNAIKFSTEGTISVTLTVNKVETAISIKDQGQGFSPEQRDHIFDAQKHYEIDEDDTKGTIGLAITKKLIELHDGRIEMTPNSDKGSTFTYYIPNSAKDVNSAVFQKNFNKKSFLDAKTALIDSEKPLTFVPTILAVDDEPVNLKVILNHLYQAGYNVEIAFNAIEALNFFKGDKIPDLLLLNTILPDMSGYDLCREIRKIYSSHELPVIMVTAKYNSEDIVHGLRAGANEYLAKPLHKDELLTRAENLISLKNSIKAEVELNKIQLELSIAEEIQRTYLPEFVPENDNFKIAVMYQSMKDIGGDYYTFLQPVKNETSLGVMIADASGHGIPASMICAMLDVIVRYHHTLLPEPKQLLSQANQALCQYENNQYLTAQYLILNPVEKLITYSNAAHLPIIVRSKDNNIITHSIPGSPLGLFENGIHSQTEFPINDGDQIILYTDGITEAKNNLSSNFGEEKLIESIKKHKVKGQELINLIMTDLNNWTDLKAEDEIHDDMCIMIIDVTLD